MHINLVELTNKFVARENVVNYVCPTSSAHKRTNFLRHHRKDFSFKFFFLKPNITSQNSVFIQNAGIIFIKYKMLVIFREILSGCHHEVKYFFSLETDIFCPFESSLNSAINIC